MDIMLKSVMMIRDGNRAMMIRDGNRASAGESTYPRKCVCPKDSATHGVYWMKLHHRHIYFVHLQS